MGDQDDGHGGSVFASLGYAALRERRRATVASARSRWRSLDSGKERLKKWKANCQGGRW